MPNANSNYVHIDYNEMQRVADEVSARYGISSDLGGAHVRIVDPGESKPCNETQHLLSDSICGPWEILKVDGPKRQMRDNSSPYKLEGTELRYMRVLGQSMVQRIKALHEDPTAGGNAERLLSKIFLGSWSKEIIADIERCYSDDLEAMSRESLPWHKAFQDSMYLTVEFFRNMAFVSTWLNNDGMRYLLEEMRCLSGEEITADTLELFWYKLIKHAITMRRNVIANEGNPEKGYWFWSTMVNLQQGLLSDYYPEKMPTPNLTGMNSLKEVALLHLRARSCKGLTEKGARTLTWSTLNAEMLNTIVRTASSRLVEGRLIVLCHPATPMRDGSQRLPVPKYAAVSVDLAARGFSEKALFQNELVNLHGLAVDRTGRVKEGYEYLEVCLESIRRVLLEREDVLTFSAICGRGVSAGLVGEYCRYLHGAGVSERMLEKMIEQTAMGPLGEDVEQGIARLRETFAAVEGEIPGGRVEEAAVVDEEDRAVEHADMDDVARKWRGCRELLDGAVEITRPTGTEWHEKVETKWKGMIDGRWVTVVIDKKTGKMYCDEGRFWRVVRSSDVTGMAEINVGFGKLGFNRTRMFGMGEVSPLRYLVSGSDRRLARMALFAEEMQDIPCSSESACYLMRAAGEGESRTRIHTASITASVLNGMDMYYDRKNGRLIVKLLKRFMELSRVDGRRRILHLTEIQGVDRASLYLANGHIRPGYKLAGGFA